MTDVSKLRKILKLHRNPNAPDFQTIKPFKNEFGFWRRKCPKCGSAEADHSFYSHWTREHDPDWKLNLVLDLITQSNIAVLDEAMGKAKTYDTLNTQKPWEEKATPPISKGESE